MAISSFKGADRDFWVDEQCAHCGICQKVCPRGNIELIEGKPAWHHNCELCFACLQWCPNSAIQHQQDSVGKARSHHPEIKASDVFRR